MTTTTDQVTDYQLTADDVKALKEADYVVIFWRPDGSEGPISGIRIGREVKFFKSTAERDLARIAKAGLWRRDYASEHSISYVRVMPAGIAPKITSYERGERRHDAKREAVFIATSLPYNTPVQSVLNLLKAGDQIGVHFVGSNNSDNDRAVNYHRDECYLRIQRKGKLVGEFLVGVMVGPDNQARMVQ